MIKNLKLYLKLKKAMKFGHLLERPGITLFMFYYLNVKPKDELDELIRDLTLYLIKPAESSLIEVADLVNIEEEFKSYCLYQWDDDAKPIKIGDTYLHVSKDTSYIGVYFSNLELRLNNEYGDKNIVVYIKTKYKFSIRDILFGFSSSITYYKMKIGDIHKEKSRINKMERKLFIETIKKYFHPLLNKSQELKEEMLLTDLIV